MSPTIQALRSIGSEFAQRIYVPILITVGIVAIILIGLNIWLVTISPWWWILLAFFILGTLVATSAFIAIGLLIKAVRPLQNKTQRKQVRAFVDKLQNIADVAGTPKIVLLFRITKDLLTKKEDSYTHRISTETLSMQDDLRDIISSFK